MADDKVRELAERLTEERQPNTELLCNSESPEPSTYCTMVLGHKGNCSWERCPICKKPTTNYIQGWKHDDGSELCQPNTELREPKVPNKIWVTLAFWPDKNCEPRLFAFFAEDDAKRDKVEYEGNQRIPTKICRYVLDAFAASIQAEALRTPVEAIPRCQKCKCELNTLPGTVYCPICDHAESAEKQLAEAQQQIEELKRVVTLQRAYLAQSPDERVKALQLDLDVEKAAMASCIATIGGVIEGNPTGRHNFLRRIRELIAKERQMDDLITSNNAAWIEMVKCDDIKLDQPLANAIFDLQKAREAAEKQLAEARAQLADIHNRFCGENGEPCQVCRLKAEREEKK